MRMAPALIGYELASLAQIIGFLAAIAAAAIIIALAVKQARTQIHRYTYRQWRREKMFYLANGLALMGVGVGLAGVTIWAFLPEGVYYLINWYYPISYTIGVSLTLAAAVVLFAALVVKIWYPIGDLISDLWVKIGDIKHKYVGKKRNNRFSRRRIARLRSRA
jgi:hypothetical protein